MANLVKLKDIFLIEYGNQFDKNKLIESQSGINFISRRSSNLGIDAKVELVPSIDPYEAELITATLGGTYLLSSFVQPEPFYTGQNIKVLRPIKSMTFNEKVYYCLAISRNRFRYTSHGREANKTFDDIMVPSYKSLPHWVNVASVKQPDKKSMLPIKLPLEVKKWKYFRIANLFHIKGTKSHTKREIAKYGEGNYPYITTSSSKNGMYGRFRHYTEEGGVLTIDSAAAGSCFYQGEKFSASDHVEKLVPKFNMGPHVGLFLKTVIDMEKFRYNYGRKFSQNKIRNTLIKLPADSNDNPDWEFMERYIKSLPYSSDI